MLALRPSAATDVTGFGLAGHLGEMLRASKGSAVLDLAALPALPGAVALLGRGIRSTAHPENARARRAMLVEPDAARRADARSALRSPDLGRAAACGAAGARPGDAGRASRGGRRGGRDHRRGGAAPARWRADPGGPDGLAPGRAAAAGRGRDLDDEAGAPAVLGLRPLPDGGDESRSDRPSTTRARPRRSGGRCAHAPRARPGDSAPSAPSSRARRPGSSGRCAG